MNKYRFKHKNNYVFVICPNKISNDIINLIDVDTLNKFTTYYDKNGNEVYENDNVYMNNEIYKVKFINNDWYIISKNNIMSLLSINYNNLSI